MKCPTCESPSPELHPAVQCEGEVQPCRDLFHASARVPVGYVQREDGFLVKERALDEARRRTSEDLRAARRPDDPTA